ncbi:hypothetical protein EC957_011048 [Mortierella hygrophila]|uniref:N-acetyltransferase domain-containing protein n=1 Tax=Mortierella hygrophila TaxID=979708 RepID=A0A9P6EUK5_9FUNG|nr:hypothetical protein EC957_011048 [Mortierella hygrophila]
MSSSFPPSLYEILTPRLVIRNAIPSDAKTLARILSSPENMPYQRVHGSISIDGMLHRIANWNKMASDGSNAFLVIALRETGEPIGTGGFNCFELHPGSADTPASEPSVDPQSTSASGGSLYLTDIGVMLDHPLWRRGYATEALCASIDFAFTELKCQLVRLETDIENEPWRALMRSLGLGDLEENAIASYNGTRGWLYKIDVETWETTKINMKASGKWPL